MAHRSWCAETPGEGSGHVSIAGVSGLSLAHGATTERIGPPPFSPKTGSLARVAATPNVTVWGTSAVGLWNWMASPAWALMVAG